MAKIIPFLLCLCALVFSSLALSVGPFIELPRSGIEPEDVAVLYLKGNKQSETIARYYQAKRGIPQENLIAVDLDGNQTNVAIGKFAVQQKVVESKLNPRVQALVLTWTQPYRVGCMSISAAFAMGFDVSYCASGCSRTRTSPYFHSSSTQPYNDFKIRPTMMLATANLSDAYELIHRGIDADDSQPFGRAFLLETADKSRSVRARFFEEVKQRFSHHVDVQILKQDAIKNETGILYYFTGSKTVSHLDTLHFLPGAMADHLTSLGGQLTDSTQMSAMRWLESGATASYGTATEPCNFVEKFPNPLIAMWHYHQGSTLLEAYWKSVSMPGQGNFIGEPLAAPFRGYRLRRKQGRIEIYSPVLRPGRYRIVTDSLAIDNLPGPSYMKSLETTSIQLVSVAKPFLEVKPPYSSRYRIERL